MTIDSWVVELHGTMHEEISRRMNRGLEKLYKEAFAQGRPMVVADADGEVAYLWPDGRLETIKRKNDRTETNKGKLCHHITYCHSLPWWKISNLPLLF